MRHDGHKRLRASLAAIALIGAAPPSPDVVARQRAVVAAADAGDAFFARRFLERVADPAEYPRPDSFYQPNTLVEGSPDQPLPRARPGWPSARTRAAIDAYAWPRKTGGLLVLSDGALAYERYAPGLHAGSLVAVRSLAKSLPTLLVGIALGEGKIGSLDDPVERYLPEWRGDARGRITLRQLMRYASGLAQIPQAVDPGNRPLRLADGSDVTAETLAWPRGRAPDERFLINQVDQQVLALVLERATGEPYARYLSTRLWRPLGAATATLNVDAKGIARAFCCMRSTLRDWLRIGQLVVQQGRWGGRQLLPAGFVEDMLRPSPASPYAGMGLYRGWTTGTTREQAQAGGALVRLQRAPYAAADLVLMQGGQTMTLWIVPSRRLVMLRWGDDSPDWDPAVIPNLLLGDGARRR